MVSRTYVGKQAHLADDAELTPGAGLPYCTARMGSLPLLPEKVRTSRLMRALTCKDAQGRLRHVPELSGDGLRRYHLVRTPHLQGQARRPDEKAFR